MTSSDKGTPSSETKNAATGGKYQLPTITHLQFLALDMLAGSPQGLAAQILKKGIAEFAPDYGGPKFYQLMGRLNASGLVTSETKTAEIAGSQVSRTFYSITELGESAWNDTIAFYLDRVPRTKK